MYIYVVLKLFDLIYLLIICISIIERVSLNNSIYFSLKTRRVDDFQEDRKNRTFLNGRGGETQTTSRIIIINVESVYNIINQISYV